MNKFLVFFLILILAVYAEKYKRIIGGSPATTSTHPYQVAIVNDDGGAAIFCGGSILSKNYVLTAAHCFRDLETNTDRDLTNVYAVSTTYISRISSSKKYSIIKANIHPAYSNSVATVNRIDLCVLQVSDIKFDSTTLPIVLARSQDQSLYPTGTPSFVSGFGLTDGNSGNSGRTPSDQLQAVEIPTISLDTCNQALSNSGLSVNYNVVCAGSDGKDSCNGDSGGPLAVVLNSNQYVQIGVVVFGTVNSQAVIQCGAIGNYGVYTDVAAYRSSFIEPITGSLPVLGDSGTATNNGTANSATSASVSFPIFLLSMIFFFFVSFY